MFKDCPDCVQPKNEDIKIWRYMDFYKFVSLLDSQSLYFCRSDRLGDPFEGSYSKLNFEQLQNNNLEDSRKWAPEYLFRKFQQQIPLMLYLNCWHVNDYESAAMWKIYTNNNKSIAIQSTFKKLKKSFDKTEKSINTSLVKYIDYEKEIIPSNPNSLFMYKRKSFEYEKELRAIIDPSPMPIYSQISKNKREPGIFVNVDLEILIEKIYLSPESPNSLKNLTQSVMKKYNIHKTIEDSALDIRPAFR